jgi:hypothetical protein
MMLIIGVLLVLSTQVGPLGCGEGEAPIVCDEVSCDCDDRNFCGLDCMDIAGCRPSCTSTGDACEAICTAEDCEFRCHSADTCGALCGENCIAICSAADVCTAETGANSEFSCTNTDACAAELGDDSVAICTSVENCSVRCLGTCTVACIFTGTCNVECVEGEKTNCGQGLFTCGTDCP